MKAITEAVIRDELRDSVPEVYTVPKGKLLSPAAREYLNQLQVEIAYEGKEIPKRVNDLKENTPSKQPHKMEAPDRPASSKDVDIPVKFKYIDDETGAGYMVKPEHMTGLRGNILVDKSHPVIKYRGKLDKLQADIVCAQVQISAVENCKGVIDDLQDILSIVRELMLCDVMDKPFERETIIGMSHKELRERSHAPEKFYEVKYMQLPEHTMGLTFALLNMLRAEAREVELAAVEAYKDGRKTLRPDVIEEWNRMSSALHVMMMKYQHGDYK